MSEYTLALGSEITIRNLQPIYESLSKSLQSPQALTINASELNKLDTAGAQLLYLFTQTCNERSLVVHWQGASPKLAENLKELGIDIPTIFGNNQ